MTDLQHLLLYSLFSGSTIFLGGLSSFFFGAYFKKGLLKLEMIHVSIAVGGGVLMAAVTLVLVPEGTRVLALFPMVVFFSLGAFIFYLIDRYVEKKGGAIAQLLSMLSDFIPESIVMGAVLSQNPQLGLLLALIMGIQNFPESFNAYLDLKSRYSAMKCLLVLFLLSFSGVASALAGYYLLSSMPMTVGALMLFSSGGIVYLIFQDIAPMSKMRRNWIPALGASLGFLVGMITVKISGEL